MFDFIKKRRSEKMKREAVEIGNRIIEDFNAALWCWREERMETRRELMSTSFDERIMVVECVDGLSFSEMADLEALALLKNWDEKRDEYASEAMLYLDDETVEGLDILGVGNDVRNTIYRFINEVSEALEQDIDQTIQQAKARRGE